MIVIIQCAAGKQDYAGHMQTSDGRKVMFVANPHLSPSSENLIYARPDDSAPTGKSWREELLDYNGREGNPHGLLPAWVLYKNPTYKELVDRIGQESLYILSAGWGLIRSDFLTPKYDITFSKAGNVEPYKRRSTRDKYNDIRLPDGISEQPIVFFGGRDYISLFCELTNSAAGPRTIYYAGKPPDVSGCRLESFGKPYTNWHYQCARSFARERFG
ncbi:MAG: hypothetical protein F4X92_09130 [Gammaproteobacteria bacterium]|nr:hypothetical protein [Gammaproteobacteria bacterium]